MDDREVRVRVAEAEEALEAIEGLPSGPRRTALDAVTHLLALYGEGWARALGRLEALHPGGAAALAEDELVGHLLMVHDLHPESVEQRVRGAIDELLATVGSGRGRSVEVLSVEKGVARLRLHAGGEAPPEGLERLVRQAVLAAAPELRAVELQTSAAERARERGPALVQLRRANGRPGADSRAGEGP